MTKQYPGLQTDSAKEYIHEIKEWGVAVIEALPRLIHEHEIFVGMTQFYENGLKVLLFYLGGDITVPKEVVDKYIATYSESTDINIKASIQEDGSWRVWSVLEKDDQPEDDQPKSES